VAPFSALGQATGTAGWQGKQKLLQYKRLNQKHENHPRRSIFDCG
jgi:hypothetical protein